MRPNLAQRGLLTPWVLGGPGGEAAEQASASASGDALVWEEEQLALQAIYDEEVSFPSERCCSVVCDVHGTRLTLDFRIPPCYPDTLPCMAVRWGRLCAPLIPCIACFMY